MTTSQDLLGLTVAAIRGPGADERKPVYATGSDDRVYQPGDWPTQSDAYPITKIRLVSEQKQSLGRGAVQFTVIATVRLVIEVSEPVQVANAGATAAEANLWALVRQHEVALINSYPLEAMIQQIASVQTQLSYSSDGATHLAGAQIDVAMEFYQGPEDFAPIETDDLEGVAGTVPTYAPAAFSIPLS